MWNHRVVVNFLAVPCLCHGGPMDAFVQPTLAAVLTFLLMTGAQVTYGFGAQPVRGIYGPLPTSAAPLATAAVDLDPGEYLIKVLGTTVTNPGSSGPGPVVSLTFLTNKQVYGLYGVPTIDKPFELQGPVHAFHGAVAQGEKPVILAAIGIWKLSAA
jgi:hypothetical protein